MSVQFRSFHFISFAFTNIAIIASGVVAGA